MQRHEVDLTTSGFAVIAGTGRSQVASLVIGPGGSVGGPDNRHPGSDQILLVLSGSGRAVVAGEEADLSPRSLLLIEAGEPHELVNTGGEPLAAVTFYAPPAYRGAGAGPSRGETDRPEGRMR